MTLSGYLYRKSHVINQTAGAGTDYQVPVKVYSGAGSDSGDSVYLNGNAAYFPNDIAFTASDGDTLLDYWHERDSDIFWVEIPDNLTNGNATIYVYYGMTQGNAYPVDPLLGTWQKYASNPVLPVGAAASWDEDWCMIHCIVKDGDTYYAYYNGGSNGVAAPWKIGLATSSDGVTWSKSGSNPALDVGTAGAWDDYSVSAPCVWKEGETWYMLYAGSGGAGEAFKIGLATSSDGVSWTKSGSNPVMSGTAATWDANGVIPGTRMLKEGSTYYLYYVGDSSAGAGQGDVGLATSTDLTAWSKSGNNPILQGTDSAWDHNLLEPHIQKFGSTYYLFFQGNNSEGNVSKVGLASSASKDSGWSKNANNPVLEGGLGYGTWEDGDWCEAPVIVDTGDEYRLYFGGYSGTQVQSGYATYEKTGDGDAAFLFFDGFLKKGGDVNATKWNASSFYTNPTGVNITAGATENYLMTNKTAVAYPCAIETRAKVGADWANEAGWNFGLTWDNGWASSGYIAGHYYGSGLDTSRMWEFPNAVYDETSESIAANTYYRLSLQILSASQKYLVDGVEKASLAVTPPQASQYIQLLAGRGGDTYSTYFDWIFARKLVATEPTHGDWGSQESLITPSALAMFLR